MASIEITPISKQKPIYNNLVKYVLNKVDDSFINKLTIINEEINLIKKTTVQKAEFGEIIEEDRNEILNLYNVISSIDRVNRHQDEKIRTLEAGGVHEVFYYDLLDLIESNSLIPNHVYKLLDYRPILNIGNPKVKNIFDSLGRGCFIIYLTASSPNTFFKEARMELTGGFVKKEWLGDKEFVCHYSPYRTGKLPYTERSEDPRSDMEVLNTFDIRYESELLIKNYWATVFSTNGYKRSNETGVFEKFTKYLVIPTKYRVSSDKDPDSYIYDYIMGNPDTLFAFVEGFVGNELPKDWYNYVEQDPYGDLILSHNIYDYIMRYSMYSGEITWMRDDLGNEAPYDFYNILHYHVYREGFVVTPELSEMDHLGYLHKLEGAGFINDYSSLYNVLLSPGRVKYKNNIAKSLYSTIIDNGDIGAYNNVLDSCVLFPGSYGCSNNIVGKSSFPIVIAGSNNIIYDGSYIIATDLNFCDIFFTMSTVAPFVMHPLFFCKLRGSAFFIGAYDKLPVFHTEFNGDMRHTPNSQFLLPQKSIIDVYNSDDNYPEIQVDRNKQGVFYIIDQKGMRHIYIFKKGLTWAEWITENDYYNGVTKREFNKTMFSITIVNNTPLIAYKGVQLERINIDGTITNVKDSSVILEDTYSVPPLV